MRYMALSAHDDKKDDMIALVNRRRADFERQSLVATKMLSGPTV